jgi:hypothetical protein
MFKFIFPSFNFNIERWKWNKEYRIYVSNMGHFKNEHKQLLKIKIDKGGYCRVRTSEGFRYAHRLVMLTWKPIPDAENLTVDHLDHNKRNNSVLNLEWVSLEENHRRAVEDYLMCDEDGNINKAPLVKKPIVKRIKYADGTNSKKYFNSIEEAAKYLMNTPFFKGSLSNDLTYNEVVSKIELKLTTGGKFFGRWTYVN